MKQDIESSQIRLKNGWKHFDDLKIKALVNQQKKANMYHNIY
jgi:hypothetical protein